MALSEYRNNFNYTCAAKNINFLTNLVKERKHKSIKPLKLIVLFLFDPYFYTVYIKCVKNFNSKMMLSATLEELLTKHIRLIKNM